MRRGQSGQTLIMFAITMVFMFLSLIALVGDSVVLMVRYNQVNSAALLGAQAGATAIDEELFYQGIHQLRPDLATSRCETTAESSAGPGAGASCVTNGNTVTATVTQQVTLPVPLFMQSATVSATRTGQAVFGGQQVVGP